MVGRALMGNKEVDMRWINGTVVALFLVGIVGVALADELAIDGVPVEKVTLDDIKKAERDITVSKITASRLGDLEVM